MVTQQVEIERKYDVASRKKPKLKLHKMERFTAGEPAEHQMSATYYDTADLALARAAVAVRRRTGGSDDGWHVKYETGSARGELHLEPLKTAPARLPAALRKLLLGLTLGAELSPVATVDTHRTVYPVLSEGQQHAELCVDRVAARDERAGVVREWTECEVELSRDDLSPKQTRAVFRALEDVLFAAGAVPSSSAAKIARALGQDGEDVVRVVPGAQDPAEPATHDAARPGSAVTAPRAGGTHGASEADGAAAAPSDSGESAEPGKDGASGDAPTSTKPSTGARSPKGGKSPKGAGKKADTKKGKRATEQTSEESPERTGADVLAEMVSGLTVQLQRWDLGVRIGAEDSVHQMRIRSRALRSVLRASHGFVGEETAADLAQRLKELARVLGDARDQEVALERLDVLLAGQPAGVLSAAATAELREAAGELGADTGRSVRRELDSAAYLQLLRDLQALGRGEGITGAAAALSPRKFAKEVLGTALERVVTCARTPLPEPGTEVEVSPMAEDVGRRITLPGSDPVRTAAAFDVLHETRKAAKSARYVAEALAAVHATPGKKRVRAAVVAKDYQDDLGVITDAAVMEEWLARAARSFQRTGRDRYAVGVLHGMELTELRTGMMEAPEILEDLVADLRDALPAQD